MQIKISEKGFEIIVQTAGTKWLATVNKPELLGCTGDYGNTPREAALDAINYFAESWPGGRFPYKRALKAIKNLKN